MDSGDDDSRDRAGSMDEDAMAAETATQTREKLNDALIKVRDRHCQMLRRSSLALTVVLATSVRITVVPKLQP